MLIGSVIVAVGCAGATIHPPMRRVCKRCARRLGHAIIVFGYWSNPNARVDWEAVRYAKWLRDHATDDRG